MNIIVKPYGSKLCYCRPDTTWERENKDFYSPDCVKEIQWAPILFVRISKAGKCIGDKFASRYYDAFNYGVLLYCHSEESDQIHYTSCIDHTSILPSPLYNPVVLENTDNTFIVKNNQEKIFEYPQTNLPEDGQEETVDLHNIIKEAICSSSRLTSLRIGDFVAVELAPPSVLSSRIDGDAHLSATYCENSIFDFKLIF